MPVVYLLHFDRNFSHARHYLGSTDDLGRRLAQHRRGDGAKLMAAINRAGIDFKVARVWRGGRQLERQLKKRHGGPRLCPICRGEVAAPMVLDGPAGGDMPY
jgi:predicted GIY-YIG superfamily endonuclease